MSFKKISLKLIIKTCKKKKNKVKLIINANYKLVYQNYFCGNVVVISLYLI